MTQQLAIDWFFIEVLGSLHSTMSKEDIDKVLEKAKQIEEKHIKDAYNSGYSDAQCNHINDVENYVNELFYTTNIELSKEDVKIIVDNIIDPPKPNIELFQLVMNTEKKIKQTDHIGDITEKVTRFEVIDHTSKKRGRIVVEYNVNVEVSIQDDGRTMKIFLTDKDK